MAENTTEVLVGGLVLVAAIGFTVYAGQVTGFSRGGGAYELRASFRSVEGVTVGTDVRLAGVKVGTVTRLELNPETYFADAVFTMDQRIVLPDDSAALISQEGLLGGNFVEIQPGGSPFDVEPGGKIIDTQGAVSLITLLLKAFTGESAPPEPVPEPEGGTRRVLLAFALTAGLPAFAQETPQAGPAGVAEAPGVVLRGLDKVTGQTLDYTLDEGESARLGRITITAGECRYPADDPASNAYAWVTILDDVAPTPVFQGWMIAAAPALNALDHARYDVWLIRCNISDG